MPYCNIMEKEQIAAFAKTCKVISIPPRRAVSRVVVVVVVVVVVMIIVVV